MKYIIYFFLFNTLSQYSGNEQIVIKANQVKEVQCFNFKIEDDKILEDSFLIVQRFFNAEGLPSQIDVYDNPDKKKVTYEYIYQSDSILTQQNTYFPDSNKISSSSFSHYNDDQKLIKSESINPKGNVEIFTEWKYNKAGQIIEKNTHYKDDIILKEYYEYDSRNRLVLVTTKKKGKTKKFMSEYHKIYYKNGLKTHIYEYKKKNAEGQRRLIQTLEYDENRRLIKTTSNAYKGFRIIGVGGSQKVDPGMRILRKMTYHENGLLKTEKEYIDGALSAFKKYYYTF